MSAEQPWLDAPIVKPAQDDPDKPWLSAPLASAKADEAPEKKTAAPVTAESRARWDLLGDIGRAAKESGSALVDDATAAGKSLVRPLPPKPTSFLQSQADVITGIPGDIMNSVKGLGAALKAPMDAIGLAASPITGAAHATLGSALSYLPGYDKAKADQDVDLAMMAGRPGKGELPRLAGAMDAPAADAALKADATAAANNLKDLSAAKLQNRAIDKVNKRADADGLTAQGVLDAQAEGRSTGDKITLMDLGKNVKAMAGRIYREGGEAGTRLDTFLKDRVEAAGGALKKQLEGIANGSTYNAIQSLFKARSDAAKPLFNDAFSSSSIAPFEKQLEGHFGDATNAEQQALQRVQQAQDRVSVTEGKSATDSNVYSTPTPDERRAAKADLDAAQSGLNAARATKEEIRTKLQRAQADRTGNAPGAVWSPRLQQFLADPDVQAGIRRGIRLEKKDAITEGRPFKDSDYAITGYDKEGEPIIGEVPTMKLLAVAKQGLDAAVLDQVHPIGHTSAGRPTQEGLANRRLRDQFVGELRRLNPKYGEAIDAWSGDSATIDAVKEGKDHFRRAESDEQIREEFTKLSPGDKEFYRLGAAEAKIDAVRSAQKSADKSKRVVNSEKDEGRFRMLFDSDAAAQKFLDSVDRQRTMFETKGDISGNSKTAERAMEDGDGRAETIMEGAKAGAHALSGNVLGTANSLLRLRNMVGLGPDQELNSSITNLLTNPNIGGNRLSPVGNVSPGVGLLQRVPLPSVQNYLAQGARVGLLNGAAATAAPTPPPNQ